VKNCIIIPKYVLPCLQRFLEQVLFGFGQKSLDCLALLKVLHICLHLFQFLFGCKILVVSLDHSNWFQFCLNFGSPLFSRLVCEFIPVVKCPFYIQEETYCEIPLQDCMFMFMMVHSITQGRFSKSSLSKCMLILMHAVCMYLRPFPPNAIVSSTKEF
jgi:hypothetical protein